MLLEKIVFISALIFSFAFLHSLLAAESIKKRFQFRFYRLFYSLVATIHFSIIFFFIVWLIKSSTEYTFPLSLEIRVFFFLIGIFGGLIVIASLLQTDVLSFIGFKLSKEEKFVKSGLYSFIRHPMYLGTIFLLVSGFLFLSNWLYFIVVIDFTAYIIIGAFLEEKKLIRTFPEYNTYKRQTPFLFPYRWSFFKRLFIKRAPSDHETR